MLRRLIVYACMAGGLVLSGHSLLAQAPALTVRDAWVRATMPGREMTGAFMIVENSGASPRALVAATADVASPVELHEMKREGDMMRMSPVKKIDVPARGSVELRPGSFHLMLFGLKAPLTAGQTVALTLEFDDGTKIPVKATVRAPGGF
ncbi:MAG: hypothetical protein AMXMBFR57_30430 [Acidimicrobiia bacterium]